METSEVIVGLARHILSTSHDLPDINQEEKLSGDDSYEFVVWLEDFLAADPRIVIIQDNCDLIEVTESIISHYAIATNQQKLMIPIDEAVTIFAQATTQTIKTAVFRLIGSIFVHDGKDYYHFINNSWSKISPQDLQPRITNLLFELNNCINGSLIHVTSHLSITKYNKNKALYTIKTAVECLSVRLQVFRTITSEIMLSEINQALQSNPVKFNVDPYIIAGRSTLIDLRTARLYKPSHKYLITEKLSYDPAVTKGGLILQFTEHFSCENKSLADILGLFVTRDARTLTIIYGVQGKTALLKFAQALFEGYVYIAKDPHDRTMDPNIVRTCFYDAIPVLTEEQLWEHPICNVVFTSREDVVLPKTYAGRKVYKLNLGTSYFEPDYDLLQKITTRKQLAYCLNWLLHYCFDEVYRMREQANLMYLTNSKLEQIIAWLNNPPKDGLHRKIL